MLPEERRIAILERVDGKRVVRADELADSFGVSLETVRRDLIELEREGALRRVHGGATAVPRRDEEPSYDERTVIQSEAKQAIAGVAAELVGERDTVIFDVGTTVEMIARNLPDSFHGRAITNSVSVAVELTGRTAGQITLAGGDVRAGDLACSGPQTVRFFDDYHADIAFLASGGVDPEWGLTDYHDQEALVRQAILRRAGRRYVVADSTKLGVVASRVVCAVADLTALVTDAGADPELVQRFRERGLEVLVAD